MKTKRLFGNRDGAATATPASATTVQESQIQSNDDSSIHSHGRYRRRRNEQRPSIWESVKTQLEHGHNTNPTSATTMIQFGTRYADRMAAATRTFSTPTETIASPPQSPSTKPSETFSSTPHQRSAAYVRTHGLARWLIHNIIETHNDKKSQDKE
mmetsp:Transcript_10413/g.18399  ORF Transcript_10413/g.18399 Transcript_10413/m.18399 type:complete len:155 (+) Transcript_10413:1-465(+)